DATRLKHSQRKVLSLIETDLWDAAVWRGVAVMGYDDFPPFLALAFKNEEPARRIFSNWRRDIGETDIDHVIRISVITGIDKKDPTAYALHITTNVEALLKGSKGEQAVITSRIHKMETVSPNTMRDFHTMRDQYGCFFLAPAIFQTGQPLPKLITEVRILKQKVIVKSAWEIGLNDPDLVALR